MNSLKPITIGFILTFLSAALAVALFSESRQDPSLRIAALVCVTTLVTNVVAIASTLLIGKDVTHREEPPSEQKPEPATPPPDQPKP